MKISGMKIIMLLFLPVLVVTGGCSGDRTFHEYAMAGDTVAVAAGWMQNFSVRRIFGLTREPL